MHNKIAGWVNRLWKVENFFQKIISFKSALFSLPFMTWKAPFFSFSEEEEEEVASSSKETADRPASIYIPARPQFAFEAAAGLKNQREQKHQKYQGSKKENQCWGWSHEGNKSAQPNHI